MGIIQKQTIKGTIYSYLGVVVGFVTAGLLFPLILSTDEIGLLNLLVSFSVLFAQFASLGFNNVINRLFPYFRNEKEGHGGFLLVALLVAFAGFFLSFGIFELLKPTLIRNNIEDSSLFVDYINYIIPLIFFTLYFNLLDNYNKAIYDAVLGTFLKEFLQRILILVSLLLYYFNVISIHDFIQLYVVCLSIPSIILLFILLIRGEFKLILPDRNAFTAPVIREMYLLAAYGILAGFGTLAILHIDRILVNKFLGLSSTGIYATNFYFATLIIIPSRSLLKISTTIIADSWKKNDLSNILLIYRKSSLNQAIIAFVILNGLWINIHNIYKILPAEYEAGKWVIFFVSLANLTTMIAGVSGTIIVTSRYFRYLTWFILIFLSLIVGLNLIFIPAMGIAGAGLTFFIATFVFNLIKFLFVYKKFQMNPYDKNILILLLIAFISGMLGYLIPGIENAYIDIIVRSMVMLVIFLPLIYFLKISEDVNGIIENLKERIGIKK